MTKEELDFYSRYIDRDCLEYIERQSELFEAAKPTLIDRYLGEYVAFEDGQVLDHDVDLGRLSERVCDRYGYRDLIMPQVLLKESVYSVGGFQPTQQPTQYPYHTLFSTV